MEIKFQTKKESNLEQELAFLKLSPGERFSWWLDLMERSKQIPSSIEKAKNDNFLIIINS